MKSLAVVLAVAWLSVVAGPARAQVFKPRGKGATAATTTGATATTTKPAPATTKPAAKPVAKPGSRKATVTATRTPAKTTTRTATSTHKGPVSRVAVSSRPDDLTPEPEPAKGKADKAGKADDDDVVTVTDDD